jgi:hypothetical protein
MKNLVHPKSVRQPQALNNTQLYTLSLSPSVSLPFQALPFFLFFPCTVEARLSSQENARYKFTWGHAFVTMVIVEIEFLGLSIASDLHTEIKQQAHTSIDGEGWRAESGGGGGHRSGVGDVDGS